MQKLLFIGLGNAGSRFENTRHNLGIKMLKSWANSNWHTSKKFQADIAEVNRGDTLITCLFPLTQMNNSGQAVASFMKKRFSNFWSPIKPDQVLIIHDDMELPLGKFKLKSGGSAVGHNGVKSIHGLIGTDNIHRLRLGIGPKPTQNISNFVLGKFSPEELQVIKEMTPSVIETLNNIATEGLPSA